MISTNESTCPICGGNLKYYDTVRRIVRTKARLTRKTYIRRFACQMCGHIHRELPNYIFPYKHYDAEVIVGVVEGLITSSTLGFEDYPCEMTMKRWRTRYLQRL